VERAVVDPQSSDRSDVVFLHSDGADYPDEDE
jgi:hypothetical protein